ncbi:glucokinase [Rhodoferax sp.]|uniref:glucokinase n=1 Tax=Rhodoferax sp. TaxID=50421 RepID=UPI00274FCEE0|nr:glucokinase [Rhodoferax sp.]
MPRDSSGIHEGIWMSQSYPRLLGDIGGTNARWAWQCAPGAPLEDVSVMGCEASASLYDAAASYLAARGAQAPKAASIGVATAVTGDDICFTNSPWSFSIAALKQALGIDQCLVINDFTALAMSLPTLGQSDLRPIGGGQAVPGAPMALLGPGTGLGVSGLLTHATGACLALSGEGGHVTLASADDTESEVLRCLRMRHGHVSAERVLSGFGLVNLYQASCEMRGEASRDFEAADITHAAIAATDMACQQAVSLFASFLGNVAGNLALTLGARGGVYVGGGIVPRLGTAFDAALFRQRFEEKGRFEAYLQAIPTWVITAATPALLGASRALDDMRA